MYYFNVTISGSGVVNGPINNVKLPVMTISEHETLRNILLSVDPLVNIGVEIAIAFFGSGVSCLLDGRNGVCTVNGTTLNSTSLSAAMLEAKGLLPPDSSYGVQITDFERTTVVFPNGTTKTLTALGYGGYVGFVSFDPGTNTGKKGGGPNYSYGKEPKVVCDGSPWGWDRPTSSALPNLTAANIAAWVDVFAHETPSEPTTDPYDPGGDSSPGGGTGTFDGTGDNIDIPSLPTLSATDTGFITLFNPSAGELLSLADYMWSNPLFDLSAWKKIFADPMDAILGLSIVPVQVPNGGSRAVTVGNISTGVTMNIAGAQYVSVDCGTLNIEEYWGAYLDYDPFTKAEIYLPYIGTHPIATDDIMGKSVHVVYHIDILSGACCAYIKCGDSVLYSFVGQCSASIPITGNDWTNVVNGALSIAASIGTMVATGGASAPMAVSAIASTAVNSMKPNIEKSGSMGGMGGMLGVQTPYLILTRPRQALPKGQNKFIGYPSFITRKLSELSGYTEIDSIHLDGIPATEQELSEIETLLKGGVIL